MKLQVIPIGIYQTNCYLIEEEGLCIAVDPGDGDGAILRYLEKKEKRVNAVIVTHGHMDHFADAAELAGHFQTPIYFPKEECAYLSSAEARRGPYDERIVHIFEKALAQRGILTEEGEELRFGSLCFRVIVLSGHSKAGMCLYEASQKILLAGDQLFAGSIGRTDLYRGSGTDLVCGIRQKLLCLPEDTVVLPGHGPHTTIGEEKRSNPFLSEEVLWNL